MRLKCLSPVQLIIALLGIVGAGATVAGELAATGGGETTGAVENAVIVTEAEYDGVPEEHYRLVEQWRVGGDDESVLLGNPGGIAVDRRGRTYVLDKQLKTVHVIDDDGRPVGEIGREGDGPGEFRRPTGIFMTGDDRVAVIQTVPARITTLCPDSDDIGTLPVPEPVIGGMVYVGQGHATADGFVCFMFQRNRRDDGVTEQYDALVKLAPDGRTVAVYREQHGERSLNDASYFENVPGGVGRWQWVVVDTGRVIVSPEFDRYELVVYDPDGRQTMRIRREYESRERPEPEWRRLQDHYDEAYRGKTRRGQPITYTVSRTDRDIQALFGRPGGALWVLSSRGAYDPPEGALIGVDEFGRSGRPTRTVALLGEGSFSDDEVFVRGDRVFVVRYPGENEEGAVEVICYSMEAVEP
jgi:hypothetical protein